MKRTLISIVLAGALGAAACTSTVLNLDVGTCFDDPETFESVEDVPIVDCENPHDNEVFANVDLTGDNFPGNDETENRAIEICYDSFSGYVGFPYEESVYDFGWLVPSEESWAAGDREVICFGYHIDFEKTTGSINGIGE